MLDTWWHEVKASLTIEKVIIEYIAHVSTSTLSTLFIQTLITEYKYWADWFMEKTSHNYNNLSHLKYNQMKKCRDN